MMMKNKNINRLESVIEDNKDQAQGLVFPCSYPVKAMGENTPKFLQEMLFIAQKHCPNTLECHVKRTESRTGKYQSITITVEVDSREHLESLYAEIKAHESVKWIL